MIIVTGPQGCGKTRNAEKIAAHFDCKVPLETDIDEMPSKLRILTKGFLYFSRLPSDTLKSRHPSALVVDYSFLVACSVVDSPLRR